jgi:DNA repair photolyase
MNDKHKLKTGRGAQINTHNRFAKHSYITRSDYLDFLHLNGEDTSLEQKTKYIEVAPKTILNRVDSPDVGRAWSMNPYQGCEHGCIYCYARNSHEYWGYSAGSEFEQNILIKQKAAELLEAHLKKRSWIPEPIMLSGNTDCYQPAEKKFAITRKVLEVLLKFKNPVGIITKNALILRDIDLLQELAKDDLVHVSISLTSLQEDLRRLMEPRTATAKKRLHTVEQLSKAGIPVNIMMAPIIPGLNSHEIMDIAKASSDAGAKAFNYTMVRLNGQIAELFIDWLNHHFPDRASKVLKLIRETHGGKLNDSTFGRRMSGDGVFAKQIKDSVALARKRFFSNKILKPYNVNAFIKAPKGQYTLF